MLNKISKPLIALLTSALLLLTFFSNAFAVSVDLFQVTTHGSQEKDAHVNNKIIAYNHLGDIWGFDLKTRLNFPLIEKDGDQFITDLFDNWIVFKKLF